MSFHKLLYLFFLGSFLLIELICCNYYENNYNYWWSNIPRARKRDAIAVQVQRHVPDWAIVYNRIIEKRRQNLESAKYRSVVYPAPYINRVAAKPRIRQPTPLLNRSPMMNYFYNQNKKPLIRKQPQYTIALQQRSLNGPKVQYFSIYPPVSPATPYYPPLKELFKESFYTDLLKRQRQNKKLEMQNFLPSKADWRFVTASRKNYVSALNNYQTSMPVYTYPYQQQYNQYRSQVSYNTNPYNSNTRPKYTRFSSRGSLPKRKSNSIELPVWDKKNSIPKIPAKDNHINSLLLQKNAIRNNTTKTFMTKKDIITHAVTTNNTSLGRRMNLSSVSFTTTIKNQMPSPWTRIERHHVFHPISPTNNINMLHNQVEKKTNAVSPVTKSNMSENQLQGKNNTTSITSKRGFLPFDSEGDGDSNVDGDSPNDVDGGGGFNSDESDQKDNSLSSRSFHNEGVDDDENKDNSEDVDNLNDNEEATYNPPENQQQEPEYSEYAKQEPETESETTQPPHIPDEDSSAMRKSPEEAIDMLQQNMIDNIATPRGENLQENSDQNNKPKSKNPKKNSIRDEESEALKEDKEAEKLMSSKDKYRMDDQPEILDINKNGVSSTADKASISASFANSLTQNVRQENRVGADTMDPFVAREMHKTSMVSSTHAFDDNVMDAKEFPTLAEGGGEESSNAAEGRGEMPTEQIVENLQNEDYHKSNPQYVNGHVKSSPGNLPDSLVMETIHDQNIDSPDKPETTNVEEDIDPNDIDSKNDEEKNALLDPEKAQERAYKLTTQREMEKKLKKASNEDDSKNFHSKQTDEMTGSSKNTQKEATKEIELSPEDALHALNGGQLPSENSQKNGATKDELPQYHKTDSQTTKESSSSVNSITSPIDEPLKNTVEQKYNISEKNPDVKTNQEKEPVVENAAVSKEVVDLLKSLGQIKSPSDTKEDTSTSSNNNKENDVSKATNTTHDISMDTEEKETKEAVHDLGIAIGILEKKLSLINEAKVTGNKKSIYIVDDPNSKSNDNAKEEKVASKSTIELNNSMRLLQKVMGVAQRFKNKNSFANQKSNVQDSKRDQISHRALQTLQQANEFNKQGFLQTLQSDNMYNTQGLQIPPQNTQRNFIRSSYPLKPSTIYQTNQYIPYSTDPWKKSDILQYNTYLDYERQPYYTPWNNYDETYW